MTHFDLDVKGSLWLLSGARDRSCRLVMRPVGLLGPEVCGSGRPAGVMGEHCTAWRAGDSLGVRSGFEEPHDLG